MATANNDSVSDSHCELTRAVNIQGNELTHLKHKSNQTTAHVTSRSALQYCQPDPHGELYQDEAPDD